MPPSKQEFKDLLANDRADLVIAELAAITKPLADQHYHNQVTLLSNRLTANKREHNLGKISSQEYNLEKNRINHALLALIDSLPQGAAASGPEKEKGFWKTMTYVALVAGILGSFAEVLGFIDLVPGKPEDSLQLTVYVQDTEGKPIPALQNTGHVIVRFDNDLRDPVIGENGRTNLGEIPAKFRGQEIEVVLVAEGYEAILPGKKYVMDGEPVYFTVRRDNSLGIIQGIVKDRSGENFLAGALVMIDQDTTTLTDDLGRFRLQLPPEKQRERYLLTVKKEGFKTRTDYYLPKTGALELRLEK
ncbi:MAG: carboxypeptidase regulatory-like domain-containing protein [Lewinellaceae bacterium]|nr:carboxypeptidase regulatory-like domain-containing protein [Lewinellaceae bacterium]